MSAGTAHRLALLQKWEANLSLPQKAVWATLMQMLPKDSPLVGDRGGWGLECSLMSYVKRGMSVEQIVAQKVIPARYGERRHVIDRRAAAAGERVELELPGAVGAAAPRGGET